MPAYPDAPRTDLVEELHGRLVADPYRELEDPAAPATVAWRQAQDALCAEQLAALPGREGLRARLTALLSAGAVGAPAWRAGRPFWTRREPGQEHAVLWTRDPDGRSRALVDVTALDAAGTTTLDAWAPSKEGALLAYQLSVGGDEESLLRVLDVTTGEVVDGPIDRCRYSPVAWEPGGQAFFYVRRLAPDAVPAGEEQFHRRVYRHRVGTPVDTDAEVWGAGLDLTNYYGCSVSRDGRSLVVSASAGTAPRDDVWLFDLRRGRPARAGAGRGGRPLRRLGRARRAALAAHRRRRAARPAVRRRPGQPVGLDDGGPGGPRGRAGGRGAAGGRPAGGAAQPARGQRAQPALWSRETAVPLPGLGSVSGLSGHPEGGSEVWLGWTDTVSPPRVHRLDATTAELSLWEDAPGRVELPAARATLIEVTSADGTTVRAQVLSPTGEPDGPRPTVLYGYGGFSVPLTPAYTASALAWVAAGGVWVVANLRGGAEEGEAWHRAGMREHKQNVFDDFAAVADALVDGGWTTPERLGIYGGSNGGLLVGAALTQRPSAYAAVVCSAPLLDMVRYELFGLGRTWSQEYGTASDPEQLGWLLSYSPYHRVQPGTAYPAVLFTVFDGDSRVDPLHARKLCAALQHATSSDAPVLLRDERDVGHGARSVSRTVGLSVDLLAFLARHTGLSLPADAPVG